MLIKVVTGEILLTMIIFCNILTPLYAGPVIAKIKCNGKGKCKSNDVTRNINVTVRPNVTARTNSKM